MRAVPLTDLSLQRRRGLQLFPRVLAQERVHDVLAIRVMLHEGFIHQRGQHSQQGYGSRRRSGIAQHGERGLALERPLKNRKGLHRALFRLTEEPPGILEDRPQAAMAFGRIAECATEKLGAGRQFLGNLLAREHAQPRGREFQRQRHPQYLFADASHARALLRAECEGGLHAPRVLKEQLHRRIHLYIRRRGVRINLKFTGEGHPRHRQNHLSTHM